MSSDYPENWPDWRDPDAYPPIGISAHLKAWEFLRRNRDYRRDFAHWAALPDTDPDGQISGKWKGPVGGLLNTFHCQPPAAADEDFEDYRGRIGTINYKVQPYAQYLTNRYRLEPEPLDPNLSSLDFTDGSEGLSPYIQSNRMAWDYVPLDEAHVFRDRMFRVDPESDSYVVLFPVDLRYPPQQLLSYIGRQIKTAREAYRLSGALESGYKRAPRAHLVKQYLRVLDANAAGVTNDEIAKTLFPYEPNDAETAYRPGKRIAQYLRAAQRLRDSDYPVFVSADELGDAVIVEELIPNS